MAPLGLRERKKARTQRDIMRAALNAFISRGYENTTLDEIAEAAEVHKRTLLRYFPTKSHLVLRGQYEALSSFGEDMSARGATPVMDVWERHVRFYTDLNLRARFHKELANIIENDPSVSAEVLRINREYLEILASAFEQELEAVRSPKVVSKVVAAALVFGNGAVYRSLIKDDLFDTQSDKMLEVVELIRGLLPA